MKLSYPAKIILPVFMLLFSSIGYSQEVTPLDIALRFMEEQKEELQLTSEDITDFNVSDIYTSKHNGVTHLYLNQTIKNIELNGGLFNVNILPNGKVLNYGNRYISDLKNKINSTNPVIQPEAAIQKVIENFQIKVAGKPQLISKKTPQNFIFSEKGLAMEPIKVDLVFEETDDEKVQLAWRVQLHQLDAKHWWNARIDALTGELINYNDQMLYCNFGEGEAACTEHHHEYNFENNLPEKTESNFIKANSYNVFPMPVQAPSFGGRELVTDPANTAASPFGWHDTDGVSGPEYTITRGNNVHAYQDIFDLNASMDDEPDGGPLLDFDFPLDLTPQRPYTQIEPAVTNLFYWSNVIHDLWYQYGFDEAAGNFQVNNYSNGGREGDHIRAEALDGSATNNAIFGTAADGTRASIQMFVWTNENLPDPPPTELVITGPDTVAGNSYPMVPGGFGGRLTRPGFVETRVVLAADSVGVSSDLCEDVTNASELEGNIAMIDRGTCEFGEKMLKAENAGAIAVIICTDDRAVVTMAPGDFGDQVTIPGVMLERADCDELKLHINELTVTMESPELLIPNPGPRARDGDYDNGIIAHEYGHGLSIRMTGGPSRGNCLNSDEQAGEGWSDWFGMVMTTDRNNTAEERRGVGTYAINQNTNGGGIRTHPYSRNMNVNPDTYANIRNTQSVHRIGSVWCAMIWDLYWNLIDQYGFDDDIYNGTGGNNVAMQLVIDGLKLQACNPSFIDSRDAILAADEANNDGANRCLIWETFARRGLGFSAGQGGNEAFDVHPECDLTSTDNIAKNSLDVSILPNPTDGIFTVKINEVINGTVHAQVTDISGKLLISNEVDYGASGSIQMNLSDYAAGVYLLHVKTEEASITQKVILH